MGVSAVGNMWHQVEYMAVIVVFHLVGSTLTTPYARNKIMGATQNYVYVAEFSFSTISYAKG